MPSNKFMNWNKIFISKGSTNRIVLATVVVLLIPLIAMQFTNEVSWQIGDFVVAGVLLLSSGYLYAILTKKSSSNVMKTFIGVIVLVSLVLIWASLAVDLI